MLAIALVKVAGYLFFKYFCGAAMVVDVLFGALAQAAPERIPAASAGTMNNWTFGGIRWFRQLLEIVVQVQVGLGLW